MKMSSDSFAASFSSFRTFLRLAITSYGRLEVFADIDAQLALRQIPDVAHRGDDLVIASEIFVDGLRLRRRLHHD